MKKKIMKLIPCKKCKEKGCDSCDGYGYNHPPKIKGQRRRLVSGEKFFFLVPYEDTINIEKKNPLDYVELCDGTIEIGVAECYMTEFDREKNFFFTKEEARAAILKIKRIVNAAK